MTTQSNAFDRLTETASTLTGCDTPFLLVAVDPPRKIQLLAKNGLPPRVSVSLNGDEKEVPSLLYALGRGMTNSLRLPEEARMASTMLAVLTHWNNAFLSGLLAGLIEKPRGDAS